MSDSQLSIDNIDLKTLQMLDELNKTHSVSQTAKNLQLTQSSISMGLAKLRRHFSDPLFVRTTTGMAPTPLAQELLRLTSDAMVLLQTALNHNMAFDPASSDRTFRLALSDAGQMLFLPVLLRWLKEAAPHVGLEISALSEDTPVMLERGEIDLAAGFLPTLDAGFFGQRLFSEQFVCIARADHPRVGASLSLASFVAESHVTVHSSATGHSLLERALREQKIQRTSAISMPNFFGVESIVAESDHLATVPQRLAVQWALGGRVKMHPLPFPVPEYLVMQHWHERYMRDPGLKWLRTSFANLFDALP
ncbi:LysR family transcriptional regulator [Paraburkholderia silviterrae]|uniref:LysR family transcriptional regulator n=1 Tax=Paraburkholderia silviterrae TaxID=2528715 RepID=A0A4R5M306_9BURK|nr:LysR family transcriptional regulator [Paraburkholderia silviterrae]TDG19959.1 LysR family transcriptional regulator [Paraburkholderia silviterrae]